MLKSIAALSLLAYICNGVAQDGSENAKPAIVNPRIVNDRWPSNYDAKSWMADVVRIEKAQSDEEKTIALYKWVRLQLHWGDQCYDGTRGTRMVECDAIKKINEFSYGFCVDFGVTSAALGYAGGLKAKEAHVPAHTELEVAYKDADGVERSHRLDPFWGVAVYDKTGTHLATWEEIKADPNVARKPSKTLLPWGDKTGDRERFSDKGACKPDLRVRPSVYTMDKSLTAGETYTLCWEPAENVRYVNNHPDPKLHDNQDCWGWIRFQYADGKPENLKYGHEVLRPFTTVEADKIMIKPAYGRLSFSPKLDKDFAESLYSPAQNIAVGAASDPRLHPAGTGSPAALIYAIRTPYVVADAELTGSFRVGKDDSIKVSLAYADWKQLDYTVTQAVPANPVWQTIWESKGEGLQTMKLKASDVALRGEYQYLIKIEMTASKDTRATGVDALSFTSVFQENPLALPRLLPGKNTIGLTAGDVRPGYALRVTCCWDDAKGKDHKEVKLLEKFPCSFEIEAAGAQPADVRSRYVSLEAVKK
jgi:hypothetical protein